MKAPTVEQPQREATASTFESGKTTYGAPDYLPALPVMPLLPPFDPIKRVGYINPYSRREDWLDYYYPYGTKPRWNKQYFK